ncbi:MAG: hypothetical protein AMXMBFR82_48640 [Candidatus Hydrogenedentota bacterium]
MIDTVKTLPMTLSLVYGYHRIWFALARCWRSLRAALTRLPPIAAASAEREYTPAERKRKTTAAMEHGRRRVGGRDIRDGRELAFLTLVRRTY